MKAHQPKSAAAVSIERRLPSAAGMMTWNLDDPKFKLPVSTGRWFYCEKTHIVYELGEQIGHGAAALVFRCRQVLLPDGKVDAASPEYAAKVINLTGLKLRADYDREREKLRREVQILSNLHHPCIVNLLHVIETPEELFLVMELVKGGELFYKIIEIGSLSEDQTRYVLIQIIHALRYMHDKSIIHRDLKPENILISDTVAPGFFRVKVADFGLAKLIRKGASQARTFVGTPQYWAPEVIDSLATNRPYGPEADLWSLGCLIYVMLGGSYPFDGRKTPLDQLIKNAQFHFRYPRFQRVSEDAKDLICGLLTVDPVRRLTLDQVLSDPWITSFKVPPAIPELPALEPFASIDYSGRLKMSTRSVLGELPALPSIPAQLQFENELAGPLVAESKKIYCQGSYQPNLHFSFATAADDSAPLFRQGSRSFLPRLNMDHPTDPNTRAIVPVHPRTLGSYYPTHGYGQPSGSTIAPKFTTSTALSEFYSTDVADEASNQQHCGSQYQQTRPSLDITSGSSRSQIPATQPGYVSQEQYARIPGIQSGIPGVPTRKSLVRSAEQIFNFEELLYLQVSMIKKFHLAYIALRGCPPAAKRISECISEGGNVQVESTAIIQKRSRRVTGFIACRIGKEGGVSHLSLWCKSIFKDIRAWVSSLKQEVNIHQNRVEQFIRHVTDLVEAIQTAKITTDKQLISSIALMATDPRNLPPPCMQCLEYVVKKDEDLLRTSQFSAQLLRSMEVRNSSPAFIPSASESSGCPCLTPTFKSDLDPRVESITSQLAHGSDWSSNYSSASRKEISDEAEKATVKLDTSTERIETIENVRRTDKLVSTENTDRFTIPDTLTALHSIEGDGFHQWYDGIREAVFQQLEILGSDTLQIMTDDVSRNINVDTTADNSHPIDGRKEGSPESAIFKSRMDVEGTLTEVAHAFMDLLFVSPTSWIDRHRRSAAQKRLQYAGTAARTSDMPTSSRNVVESSGSLPTIESVGSVQQGKSEDISNQGKERSSEPCWNGQKWSSNTTQTMEQRRKKIQVYKQALITSELLIKALDELRRIDQILRKSTSFWLNLNTVIERLCQMKTHVERLLQYSAGSAVFTQRFFERLGDYHEFWSALRDKARNYVAKSQVKLAAMEDFAVALASMADRVDTANALYIGEVSACMALEARRRVHGNRVHGNP